MKTSEYAPFTPPWQIERLIAKTLTSRKIEVSILENDVTELVRNAQAVSAAFRRLKSAVVDGECESDVSEITMSHRLFEMESQLRSVRQQYAHVQQMDNLLVALYHEVAADVKELTLLLPPSLREQNALVKKEVR